MNVIERKLQTMSNETVTLVGNSEGRLRVQRQSQNVIPIAPVKKTFVINQNGTKVSVTRSQLPLTLAYAFTDYRSQGQMLQPVLVDIVPPSYGCLTPFNIYVALSRGTGRDNIRLIRDFDHTLLQQHPSEYLRLEDESLQRLNELTKELWPTRNVSEFCIQLR